MNTDKQIILYSLGLGLLLYMAFVDEHPYIAHGVIIGAFMLLLIFVFLPPLIDRTINNTLKKIETTLEKIELDTDIENDSSDILALIRLSARLIGWVRVITSTSYFYRSKHIHDSLVSYGEYIENRLLQIYRKIQYDLLAQMKGNQSQLQKAKVEIQALGQNPAAKNTMLMQNRIDLQIEQFEFLQGKLMKL